MYLNLLDRIIYITGDDKIIKALSLKKWKVVKKTSLPEIA